MQYYVTIAYDVTSRNTINLLGTAITPDSFLVSRQVLRCQGTTEHVVFFSERQYSSYI